jgi:hypothetical protein
MSLYNMLKILTLVTSLTASYLVAYSVFKEELMKGLTHKRLMSFVALYVVSVVVIETVLAATITSHYRP